MANTNFIGSTDNQVLTTDQFLKTIWGEIPPGKVLIWTLPDKKSRWYVHFENVTADMRFHEKEDVYTGVGLAPHEGLRLPSNKRLKEWEVTGIAAFWSDIDVAHPVHKTAKQYPPSIEKALDALEQLPFAATIIVHSGHGVQLWWVLKEVWIFEDEEDRERARRASQWWHQVVKGIFAEHGWDVDSTFDLPRVMRLPGTWNNKEPEDRRRVEVTGGCGERYDRQQFLDLVPEDFQATPMRARRNRSGGSGNGNGFAPGASGLVLDPEAEPSFTRIETLLKLEPRFRKTWENQRPDLADQSPSAYDMALANYAVRAGWPDQEVANLLIAFRKRHRLDPKLREDYYAVTIAKAHEPYPNSTSDLGETAGGEVEVEVEVGVEDREVTLESLTRPSRENATEAANALRFLVDHSDHLVVAYDPADLAPADVYAYTEQGTLSVGALEGMLLETSRRHMALVKAMPKKTPGCSEIIHHAQRFDDTRRLPVVINNLRGAIALLRRAGLLPESLVIKRRRDINANLRYMGAPNGVFDLHTGLFLPPDEARETFTAAQIPDDYDPQATHPAVDAIMPEIPASQEMEWWYQARGYLFAKPPAKQFVVMLTPPDSGKTVWANSDKDSFGPSYVSSIRPQTLQKSDYSGPTAYNDGLLSFGNGMRALYQSETKGNQDVGLINLVTGGERSFPARGIKEKEVMVQPSAHLIMQSNIPETGAPELRFGISSPSDETEVAALRERMYMLPMPTIPKAERNPAYLNVSATNTEGSVEFRQAWVARTVRQCMAMAGQLWPDRLESQAAALDDLKRRETDPWVSEWLENLLVPAPGSEVHSRQIYADYEIWYEENGGTKQTQRAVTAAVAARYGPGKSEVYRTWQGKRAKVVLWRGFGFHSQQ